MRVTFATDQRDGVADVDRDDVLARLFAERELKQAVEVVGPDERVRPGEQRMHIKDPHPQFLASESA